MVKINEFKIIKNDANLNNEIIKINITKEIQQLGKELVIWNHILREIMNFRNLSICYSPHLPLDRDIKRLSNESNFVLLELANKIQEKKAISESRLNLIIKNIVASKNLKKIFNIKGSINNKETNLLLEDIDESLEVLTFYKDEDISNLVLAYTQKFIGFDN